MQVAYEMPSNWFGQVFNGSEATLLELPISLGLQKGDNIEFIEIDINSNPSGAVGYGTVAEIPAGQFFSLTSTKGYYYIIDLKMASWIDYSASSTINGFSSFTTKIVMYKVEGDTLFFMVDIFGGFSGTSVNFTLPIAPAVGHPSIFALAKVRYNGLDRPDPGPIAIEAGNATFVCYANMTTANWPTGSTRYVRAEGFYKIDT